MYTASGLLSKDVFVMHKFIYVITATAVFFCQFGLLDFFCINYLVHVIFLNNIPRQPLYTRAKKFFFFYQIVDQMKKKKICY